VSTIFRQSSLDRLSSPEQLDQLIRITSRRSWIALLALGAVVLSAVAWGLTGTVTTSVSEQGMFIRGGGLFAVETPSAGQVQSVSVGVGQQVNQGQTVAQLQPSGGGAPVDVVSPYRGKVLELLVNPGQLVSVGAGILNLEESANPLEVVVFFPASVGKQVRTGMKAEVAPSSYSPQQYGYMVASVDYVAPFLSSAPGMMRLLQNQNLVQLFLNQAGGSPIEVHLGLTPDTRTPSGYLWSSSKGPDTTVTAGTLASVSVAVSQQRPISLVLPEAR
jgi:pyruvate/2-oxoglutarate dehydrogenase complex dihydrolipoamide acyltransferase (E2) component